MNNIKNKKRIRVTIASEGALARKIEIATQTLERNIGFINNCDTKTSIVLATIGALLTIILTNDGLKAMLQIVTNCAEGKSFCNILYLVTLFSSVGVLIFGLWKLTSVLIAKTAPLPKGHSDKKGKSLIFFGGIVETGDSITYHKKFVAMRDSELLEELVSEIYINAEIANQKYRRYNQGLKCSVWGFALSVALFVIGYFLY